MNIGEPVEEILVPDPVEVPEQVPEPTQPVEPVPVGTVAAT